MSQADAVSAVARFLQANYPCGCDSGDPECTREIDEADEIVTLVLKYLDK